MKKLLLILLPLLFLYTNSYSQSNSRKFDKYKKYRKAKNDEIKYMSEKVYWESFVKNTDRLYKYLKRTQKATDDIMVVSKVIPGTGKVRLFYKGGKLIAAYTGKKLVEYYKPRKGTKDKSRKTTYASNKKYSKQRGDRISYMTEASFYKKYLRKKLNKKYRKKKRKIMVVSRQTSKGKRYMLFYKKKKLVGQLINGKFFKE